MSAALAWLDEPVAELQPWLLLEERCAYRETRGHAGARRSFHALHNELAELGACP